MMVIITTRITQMHDIVKTLQDGPESVKEILWSEVVGRRAWESMGKLL